VPLDVIMPALGMAQDSGTIVAWRKQPGDAVSEGDVLFEVETDKTTMEVEAAGAGYLTDVAAGDGDDVPVGKVIARISETTENGGATGPAAREPDDADGDADGTDDLPQGHNVIMPTLGMAQDSGLIVAWSVAPGDRVAEGDILFEVETDKSTMEVEAQAAGYVAALLAEAGEDVPTGQTIAILTDEPPASPISRSSRTAAKAQEARSAKQAPQKPTASAAPKPLEADCRPQAPPSAATGKILASPKLRRLALERGLDLSRLVEAGLPQPFHVKDLDRLEKLSTPAPAPAAATAGAARRLTAEVAGESLADLVAWLEEADVSENAALAAFAAASLGELPTTVAVERPAGTVHLRVPSDRLGAVERIDDASPDLRIRDLRGTPMADVEVGPEEVPVITLTRSTTGTSLTLECAADQLTAPAAIRCLTGFAGRLEEPLRHLL
jgi:pyruvate/2-oxoglutarate dehydrogenase complex dihydrolipoamide acyltransferase (E2) component